MHSAAPQPHHSESLTTDELRSRAEDAELQLRRALQQLEGSLRSQVDPVRLFAEYGETIVVGAFVLGLVIGLRRR